MIIFQSAAYAQEQGFTKYEDLLAGYSIDYPSDWEVRPTPDGSDFIPSGQDDLVLSAFNVTSELDAPGGIYTEEDKLRLNLKDRATALDNFTILTFGAIFLEEGRLRTCQQAVNTFSQIRADNNTTTTTTATTNHDDDDMMMMSYEIVCKNGNMFYSISFSAPLYSTGPEGWDALLPVYSKMEESFEIK
jgi:hypothetical protein